MKARERLSDMSDRSLQSPTQCCAAPACTLHRPAITSAAFAHTRRATQWCAAHTGSASLPPACSAPVPALMQLSSALSDAVLSASACYAAYALHGDSAAFPLGTDIAAADRIVPSIVNKLLPLHLQLSSLSTLLEWGYALLGLASAAGLSGAPSVVASLSASAAAAPLTSCVCGSLCCGQVLCGSAGSPRQCPWPCTAC